MELQTQPGVLDTISLVAKKTGSLVERTIGRPLPITYLTVFSHTTREYESLTKRMRELGAESPANNGLQYVLLEPIQTLYGPVHRVRIRAPDQYRHHVGCADFQVENYVQFKELLPKHPGHMRCIVRPEYEMLEFFDLEQNDVLAYIVSS